jgi:hypothetical protein
MERDRVAEIAARLGHVPRSVKCRLPMIRSLCEKELMT